MALMLMRSLTSGASSPARPLTNASVSATFWTAEAHQCPQSQALSWSHLLHRLPFLPDSIWARPASRLALMHMHGETCTAVVDTVDPSAVC